MTSTYVAWNGQSYPWPPPDGWYKAADGQWWAPGTGPDRPGQDAAEDDRGTDSDQETVLAARADHDNEQDHSDPAPAPPASDTSDATDQGEAATLGPLPSGVTGNGPETDSAQGPSPSGDPSSADAAAAGSRGGERAGPTMPATPVLVGGGLAALLAIVLLVMALTGSDDDEEDDTATPTTATTSQVSETSAPPTTEATTTVTTAVTTTRSDEEKVADFRTILVDNGLSSEQLTDNDIVEVGTAFCAFAKIAQDEPEFAGYRQEALLETGSELTDEELTVAINAAVVSFCPDEASRLGVEA